MPDITCEIDINPSVARAVADLTNWKSMAIYAFEQTNKAIKPGMDLEDIRDRFHNQPFGTREHEIEQYLVLRAGAEYLCQTRHPFPQNSDASLPIDQRPHLLLAVQIAFALAEVFSAFTYVTTSDTESDEGKQAAVLYFQAVKRVKEIIPETTLKSIMSSNFSKCVHPKIRARINELTVAALTGKKPTAVIVDDKPHTLTDGLIDPTLTACNRTLLINPDNHFGPQGFTQSSAEEARDRPFLAYADNSFS